MGPENFKKKIWKHFWLTLFLALVLSLVWEFGLAGVIKPAISSLVSDSENHLPWLNAVMDVSIVLLALVLSVPALMGGVHETTRKTVTELGKTERRYKSIVDSTNDLIFQLDGHGIVIFANPAVRLLGYEDGDLLGKFIGDLLFMDNKDEIIPKIMTKRVGHRATYHLPVQLATSPDSVISSEIPAMEFVLDACGLWEEPDERVQVRGGEKNFLGTLCIARPVVRPEDLVSHERQEEAGIYE